MNITTKYRRSRKEWEADPGEWSDSYALGSTKKAAIEKAVDMRRVQAVDIKKDRRIVNELEFGLRQWLKGDIRYCVFVLAAWPHYSGYACDWDPDELPRWKSFVVDGLRYMARNEGWVNGYGWSDCPKMPTVWYADTPKGQISFHVPAKLAEWKTKTISRDFERNQRAELIKWLEEEMSKRGRQSGMERRKFLLPGETEIFYSSCPADQITRITSQPYVAGWDRVIGGTLINLQELFGVKVPAAQRKHWTTALRRCACMVRFDPIPYRAYGY